MSVPSTLPSVPIKLPTLTTREAIVDALYRSVGGLDTGDATLFDSAFTEDAVMDLNGRVMNGRALLHSNVFDRIANLDTTHFITNVRVNYREGEPKATLTAFALAQHYHLEQGREPGAASLMSGGRYYLELVLDDKDGLWKTTLFTMRSTWLEGDRAVVSGNAPAASGN